MARCAPGSLQLHPLPQTSLGTQPPHLGSLLARVVVTYVRVRESKNIGVCVSNRVLLAEMVHQIDVRLAKKRADRFCSYPPSQFGSSVKSLVRFTHVRPEVYERATYPFQPQLSSRGSVGLVPHMPKEVRTGGCPVAARGADGPVSRKTLG